MTDDDPDLDDSAEVTESDPASADAEAQESRPPRFRAATRDQLDPQSFMVADHRSALRAVLRGGSISSTKGDAEFIGGVIRRIAKSLRQTAEQYRRLGETIDNPLLRNVAWTSSVVIELEISQGEHVNETIDGLRRSPTIDAARALGDLLSSDADELLPQAVRLGPEPIAEYKRLLHLIGSDDVTLEWQAPNTDRIAVVTSADAAKDYAILDREGQPTSEQIQVPGTLTMADSRRHRFELSLPPTGPKHPLLGRRKTVYGEYADELGDRLKKEGLWDAEVMATIEVTHDLPETSAIPREPAFVLIDAEHLINVSPGLF